jgi:undecaprenyl-diphosphatase
VADIFAAAILGIVEGVSEFMPISSSTHLVLTDFLLKSGLTDHSVLMTTIQFAAILAILIYYRNFFWHMVTRFFSDRVAKLNFLRLFIVCLPFAVVGLITKPYITRSWLESIPSMGIWLVLGGVVMLLFSSYKKDCPKHCRIQDIPITTACFIGLIQVLALIPGFSRSAVTIIAGLWLGLDRKTAVEFSFLSAVPLLFAATIYTFLTASQHQFVLENELITAFICALIVALILAPYILRFIILYGLVWFGWYRVCLGSAIIIWWVF